MLTTHSVQGRLRRADNLIPRREGGVASRPSLIQALAGEISAAAPWGNRVLAVRSGRHQLWDGVTTVDFGPAGLGLSATSFQALVANGVREDRLYVADSVQGIWYITRSAGNYLRRDVVNSVKDAQGAPYAIPVPQVITTWASRLWIGFGTNRVQHCQADAPEEWDPLWTQEFQGSGPGKVLDMLPSDDALLVGLGNAVWAVSGTSQFNFQTASVRQGVGVAGLRCMVADGGKIYIGSSSGLFDAGVEAPVSEEVREIWESGPIPVELALDRKRRLLLVLTNGRLLVMHLDRPGAFGEIRSDKVVGLIATDDYTGFYGRDGLWFFGPRDYPDVTSAGLRTAYTSIAETWDDIPNENGNGRAVLARTYVRLTGSSRGSATYTATVDDFESRSAQFALTDRAIPHWSDQIAGLAGEPWPAPPVLREVPVHVAGGHFSHRLSAPCHLELESFRPEYQFGPREE